MNYVSIKLDKERNIKLTYKAQKVVEDVTGKAMFDIIANRPNMSELGVLLYAGLLHEDKELTLEKVEDLIDEYSNPAIVMEAVSKAIDLAYKTESDSKNVQRAVEKNKKH